MVYFDYLFGRFMDARVRARFFGQLLVEGTLELVIPLNSWLGSHGFFSFQGFFGLEVSNFWRGLIWFRNLEGNFFFGTYSEGLGLLFSREPFSSGWVALIKKVG